MSRDFTLTKMVTVKPWGFASHGRAICPDGVIRYFRITGQPDTFFSIPAQVKYKGKTVTGFITTCDTIEGKKRTREMRDNYEGDYTDVWSEYEFRPNKYGKNGDIFPSEECTK